MKRKYIFISVAMGTTALLLTGCTGGSTENRQNQAAVSDTDETASGAEGTEGDTVEAEMETADN